VWPAVGVLLVVLVFVAVLPLVDALLPPKRQVVRPGTEVELTVAGRPAAEEQTVRFVPASGWEQQSADGQATESSALAKDGVEFEVDATRAPVGGCEEALTSTEASLQRVDESGTLHEPQSFTTSNGEVGLAAAFVGAHVEGMAFVICTDQVTASATASGSVGALQGSPVDAIVAMAQSIEIR
jgi:hypothetical protein